MNETLQPPRGEGGLKWDTLRGLVFLIMCAKL